MFEKLIAVRCVYIRTTHARAAVGSWIFDTCMARTPCTPSPSLCDTHSLARAVAGRSSSVEQRRAALRSERGSVIRTVPSREEEDKHPHAV